MALGVMKKRVRLTAFNCAGQAIPRRTPPLPHPPEAWCPHPIAGLDYWLGMPSDGEPPGVIIGERTHLTNIAGYGFRASAAERRDRAPAPTAGTIALMSIENGHAHPDEVTALREEVARLLQELRMALEMLQIMQEELQAAHDALSSN